MRYIIENRIYMGIKTGLNEAFVIDCETKRKLIHADPATKHFIKPFALGRHVRRWRLDDVDCWLLFLPHGVAGKGLDSIKDHLAPFRARLERRATQQEWYELQQPQAKFAPMMEVPKIITAIP